MDRNGTRHRRWPRFATLWPAAAAGLVGLSLTALATVHAHRMLRAEAEGRFQAALIAAQEALDGRMEAYIALLLAGRGLFEASQGVDRAEFRAWAEALDLARRYPGIQGVGFAAAVPAGKLESFEARARAGGESSFTVTPPGDRPLVAPILYLEPQDERNRAALGFDMFSEPVRREAMERARDTGLPAATGLVTLRQETTSDKQAGFLIYVPVYTPGHPTGTVAERRAALQGWVYAPFRAQDLVDAIFERHRPEVELEAYDATTPEAAALLFDTNDRREALQTGGPRVRLRTLDIAGRPWILVFSPQEPRVGQARWLPLLVALVGCLGSVLLFGITWVQSQGRRRERVARAKAERAEAEATFLADASQLLAASLDVGTTIEQLARRMVPFLGELCIIDVIAEERGLERQAIAVREDEPRLAGAERVIREQFPLHSSAVHRVIANGRAEIVPVVTRAWLEAAYPDPAAREAIAAHGHGAIAIFPLSSRDRAHGAMILAAGEPYFFDRSRAALAAEVARRAAQALDSAWLYRQAQDAVRVRDDFLSIASHELRTPLTSLQAQVQGLRRGFRREGQAVDPVRIEDKLAIIERQVRRLGKLIGDLLDVARIQTGRFEVQRERFELADLVREAIDRFDDRHEGLPVTLTAAGPAVGNWDRFRLEQVVVNLLGNAVKYGAGQPVEVAIATGPTGVRLTVADRGIGIPPEKQAQVFERFARAVSDRHYGGLGLGLYIVREIVEAHGGTVRAENRPGGGTVFTVELPWGEEEPAAQQA